MKLSALIAPLLDAKVDHELIRQQIVAFEAEQQNALEQRRAADAERQSRKRERDKSRDVTLRHSDRFLTGERVHTEDKTLPSEDNKQEENKKRATDALRLEFDETFWPEYPHKTGKPAAFAKFCLARKHTEFAVILDGLRRYVASKPAERAWLNPATFLNQERWADQPAVVVPMARGSPRRNPIMDRLDAMTRPPNDDDPEPSQAPVFNLPATAYR